MTIGCAHGRFQIFHEDHLRYISESYLRCDHLLIGITGTILRPATGIANGSHRTIPENNPFTYYERTQMIRAALAGREFNLSKVTFTPFPIEFPEILQHFVPKDVHCFTTIREEWNRQKVQLLLNIGYPVTVLYTDMNKIVSGSMVRHMIRSGNPAWKKHVPAGTACYLEETNLLARLFAEAEARAEL